MNEERNQDERETSEAVSLPRSVFGVWVLRRVLLFGAWITAGLFGCLFFLLLAVQFDPVSSMAGRWIAGAVSSGGLRVEVERVTGSWVGGLTVSGLRAENDTTGWVFSADSLALRYRLLPLLRRTVAVREVVGSGVTARVPLPASAPPVNPDSAAQPQAAGSFSNWKVRVGSVDLQIVEVDIQDPGRADGEPWLFSGGRILAHDLRLNPNLAMVIDTVAGDFRPPGRPEGWGKVLAVGRWSEAGVQVDTFFLRSPESDVSVWGSAPVPLGGLVPPGLDFRFSAQPFSFADVGPFLPAAISDSIRVDADGFARTVGDAVDFSLRVEAGVAGTILAEGSVRGDRASPTITARVRGEDLALQTWGITRSPLSLNGILDTELEGTRDTIRGTADLQADVHDPATSRDLQGQVRLWSDSIGGGWRGVWSATTKGLSASGDLEATPSARPTWGYQGQVSYDRAKGAPPVPGMDLTSLVGTFQLEGEGISLDSLRVRGQARVGSARVGRADVDSLRISGDLESGEATFSLNGGLAGGFVDARGTGNVLQRTGRLLDARVQELDVASLLGDSVASSLNASATGRLTSAVPLGATASLTLGSSLYGGRQLDSASVVLRIEGQSFDFRGRTALQDSSRVWASGRVESGSVPARLSIDSIGYTHLDLRSLTGGLPPDRGVSTDLNGAGVAWAIRNESGWAGRAEMSLDSSWVGGQRVDGAKFAATLDSFGALLDIDVQTRGGGVVGGVRAEGIQGVGAQSITISDLRFTALNPGVFLDRTALGGSISGRINGEIQNFRLAEMVGGIQLELDSSRVSALAVEAGSVEVRLNAGLLEATAVASAGGGGEVHLEASADLTGTAPTYESHGTVHLPELGEVEAGVEVGGSLFGGYELDGVGFQLDSLAGTVSVTVDSARWAGVPLDPSRLRMALNDRILSVDTLFLTSPVGSVWGGGRLPLEASSGSDGELSIHAELDRADLLANLLSSESFTVGSGVIDATATGSMDDLHLIGEAQMGVFLWNNLRVQGLDLQGEAHRAGKDIKVATGHLTVSRLQLPEASVRQLDVHADLEPGDELALTASADIDDLRNASLSAHLEGMWDASVIRIDSLEFHAEQDHWRLSQPSRINYRNGIEIDSLQLLAPGQEVTARGRVATEGPLSLEVALSDFDVQTVADLLGYPELRGKLTGSLQMSGTADSPTLDAQFQTRLDPLSPSSVDLDFSTHYAQRELEFETRVAMTEGRGGILRGYLPLSLSLAGPSEGLSADENVRIEVEVDSLPLGWVSPLLPAEMIRNLDGVLDGSVQIAGQADAPTYEGFLALVGGSAAFPALGVRHEQGDLRLTFSGDGMQLDSLLIRSGGGSMSGSGSVRLSPIHHPEFDLTLVAQQFRAVSSPAVDAVVSGQVRLTGSPMRPSVSGRIDIDRANLYLADLAKAPDVRAVSLTEEDYLEMASVFGYRPPDQSAPSSDLFEATKLDLDVQLRRDSWVRQQSNPHMAIQFTGQMSIQKEAGDSLQLVGSLEGVPARSYVEQFGKRFSLANATLVFEGAPTSTQVDVTAEYEVRSRDNPDAPQVVIALDISGTPEELSLELSSTPALEASDMVSYLVTGRPADRSLESGGGSLSETGGVLALSGLSGAVEAYAREQVGLDVVEITTDGLDGVTLVAGRYVSPSLYLGIRQPVSLHRTAGDASQRTPTPEIEVELEAIRWLLLNLQAGGLGGAQFYFRSRVAYD